MELHYYECLCHVQYVHKDTNVGAIPYLMRYTLILPVSHYPWVMLAVGFESLSCYKVKCFEEF